MSFADVEMKLVQWGEARGIIQNGKPLGQARKTLEEAGELIEATAKLQALNDVAALHPSIASSPEFRSLVTAYMGEARDAIGDVGVTLVMGCGTLDVSFVECLKEAYAEIKDRKGFLRPDGVFVKASA